MSLRIQHRIGISAPAEAVWALLFDVNRWSHWNPLYPKAEGRIGMGETLRLTEQFPGLPPREIAPVILDWEPNNQILWRTNGLMARCVRYIEVEALTETGCIFANGAFFHGVVGQLEAKRSRRAIHEGYQSLGEAVKRLAEAGRTPPGA